MNTTGKLIIQHPGPELIRMDQSYFPNPWTHHQWQELDPEQNTVYAWRTDTQIEGFALFGTIKGDDSAHLFKLLIHPDRRGSGTSGKFWSAIVNDLITKDIKSVYLEVESSNLRAIGFYEKNGFKLLHLKKAFYSNGEDALIMLLTL